ncbi:hypothetical protein [Dyadobacter arcticus]|uniref:DUF4397 domain-containing protein n=1 Tax=Dyadobacter arcticus TaxID=1078754 RepID=A0ABX0UGB4_9BACT|nr:hypothetical protein [Dyadobacter arcticus]NIJ52037.1 hypothetical protein [Dyadobacter arcticus]
MRKWINFAGLMLAIGITSCNDDGLDAITTVDSNFETGLDGWSAEFADYSTETDTAILDFASGQALLPTGLDTTQHAYAIQSMNRSDDVFMFLKKRIKGLVPNGTYSVVFDLTLGTNYPENSFGIGGSPGSSVYLKAGASGIEPGVKLVNKFYEFTLDKGQQSEQGEDALVLGNVANEREDAKYALVKRTNADKPFTVKANAQGEVWLFVGTDSGYEGLTLLYYDRIVATIKEVQVN